jgi:hypothetical protein
MEKKYSIEDLLKLQNAMEEYLEFSKDNQPDICLYCKMDKADVYPDNFIPICNSCNIEISQMLEYFFNKYPELVEEILSDGKPYN